MKIGISSYSFIWSIGVSGFDQPTDPMTALQLLDEAGNLDVRVVQIADNLPLHRMTGKQLAQVSERAAELGIQLELGTRGMDAANLTNYLDISRQVDASLLRTIIDPLPDDGSGRNKTPSVKDIVKAIRHVARTFEEANIPLVIENHDSFPAAVLREIVEGVDSSHVGICLDTANAIGSYENPIAMLDVLHPWVWNVHLKDFQVSRLPHQHGYIVEGCELGQGGLQIFDLLRCLDEFGYSKSLIIELWPPPLSNVEASISREREWIQKSVQFIRNQQSVHSPG